MTNTLWLVIETIGSLLATACVLRAFVFRVHLSPRNPLSQFVHAITDWLVKPLSRVLPAKGSIDWASLVAAIVIAVGTAVIWTLLYMQGRTPAFGAVMLLGVFWLVKWTIYLLIALVIMQAILSWVNPDAPIAPAINLLTAPFLAPIRKILPLIGGVDLSPLVLILLAQVLLMLLAEGVGSIAKLPV
jgi:YggT family protein